MEKYLIEIDSPIGKITFIYDPIWDNNLEDYLKNDAIKVTILDEHNNEVVPNINKNV